MPRRKRISPQSLLKSNKIPHTLGGVIIFLLLFGVGYFVQKYLPESATSQQSVPADMPEGVYEVERCVDGDTLLLTNSKRIRMIGANTPETVKPNSPVEPFGPEASAYTKRMIANAGNKISIIYDGTPTDKYGRVLAMVWIGDLLLNEDLIRQGLAKAETQYNYSREKKDRFVRAEDEAKSARRGIWSQTP